MSEPDLRKPAIDPGSSSRSRPGAGPVAEAGPAVVIAESEPASLSPRFVRSELRRLGVSEWAPIRFCARADRSSVNRCPLDPLIGLRTPGPPDRETRCPVSRPDRERFVSRMTVEMRAFLPFGGLHEAEFNRRKAARLRFDAMTAEHRAMVTAGREKGMVAIRRARLSSLTTLAGNGTGPDAFAPGSGAKFLSPGGASA